MMGGKPNRWIWGRFGGWIDFGLTGFGLTSFGLTGFGLATGRMGSWGLATFVVTTGRRGSGGSGLDSGLLGGAWGTGAISATDAGAAGGAGATGPGAAVGGAAACGNRLIWIGTTGGTAGACQAIGTRASTKCSSIASRVAIASRAESARPSSELCITALSAANRRHGNT